jgi:hypothetical protein
MKCSAVLMTPVCAVLVAGAMLSAPSAGAGQLPATGQTTAYQADKNDGIAGPVDVPDDGTLQSGATLRYKLLENGTVKDRNTGLIWEVKCSGCGGLHEVGNTYPWFGDGSTDTIWDWLDAVNAEGGTGYAGHNDWRIPNVRELQSIVDYGRYGPPIDPIFGPTGTCGYWSSTTLVFPPSSVWFVAFDLGSVNSFFYGYPLCVRAVRGGPK